MAASWPLPPFSPLSPRPLNQVRELQGELEDVLERYDDALQVAYTAVASHSAPTAAEAAEPAADLAACRGNFPQLLQLWRTMATTADTPGDDFLQQQFGGYPESDANDSADGPLRGQTPTQPTPTTPTTPTAPANRPVDESPEAHEARVIKAMVDLVQAAVAKGERPNQANLAELLDHARRSRDFLLRDIFDCGYLGFMRCVPYLLRNSIPLPVPHPHSSPSPCLCLRSPGHA